MELSQNGHHLPYARRMAVDPADRERWIAWFVDACRRDYDLSVRGNRTRLADAVGVSQGTINAWVEGRSRPDRRNTLILAKVLRKPEQEVSNAVGGVDAAPDGGETRPGVLDEPAIERLLAVLHDPESSDETRAAVRQMLDAYAATAEMLRERDLAERNRAS